MRCKEVEGLLAGRALEELSAPQKEGVDEHLQGCPSCAQGLEAAKQTLGLLGAWEQPEPPPQLVAQTLAALEAEKAAPRGLRDKFDSLIQGLLNLRVTPAGGGLAVVLGVFIFVALHNFQVGQIASSGSGVTCQENVRALGKATKEFREAHEGQAPDNLAELAPAFIGELPNCPVAGFDTYSQSYKKDPASQDVEIFCRGNHHLNEGLPPNSPRLSSGGK